jgi:WhiB family redox-sensing transcriptional regulator
MNKEPKSASDQDLNLPIVPFRSQSAWPAMPNTVGSSNPLSWQQSALCAQTDPKIFFPEHGGSAVTAKKICHACIVENDCLHFALDNREESGVWGGLSNRERRKLKRTTDTSYDN